MGDGVDLDAQRRVHGCSLRWSMSWSVVIPSARASSRTGPSVSSQKVARRCCRSSSRAPSETNMPSPRRLCSRPSSTSVLIALAAVAGLMRWVVAYCVVDMTWAPSGRSPTRTAWRIRSAICW
ncbi:hypothetical protein [Ornithinimicrobium kibberense]|uniref:hypothetical protein n=1 Tax=Ornithinimicrobium kibberense TaxID=282060 RepID=UPI00361AF383